MSLGPLMLDIAGTSLDSTDKALLQEPAVGGVILFSRNYQDRPQLQQLIAEIRSLRPEILLAVDQEGGRVQRFRKDFTRIPAMQVFYSRYCQDPEATESLVADTGWLMATELLACELDFSFAPVLDVDRDRCAVIADRSFADDPAAVTRLAGAFVRGMHDAGMAATGKHYPGHGGVVGDSHLLLPVDERRWAEIRGRDQRPFADLTSRTAIDDGCALDAIMPAHILFPEVDDQPVGFSPVWLQQHLRKELGFDGVIFSDDLSMEGATGAGSYAERAKLALKAGCDMVLVCNNRNGALEVLSWLTGNTLPDSPRLLKMSRRKSWSWDALVASPRWQKTVKALSELEQAS